MAKTKLKLGDVVQVDWGDAWSRNGWQDTPTEKDTKGFNVTQCATFVKENKHGILLTLGIAVDGQYSGLFFIPRGMILKVNKLVDKSKIKTAY